MLATTSMSLGKILLAFALLHFVLQGQTCLLLYLLTSYFCIPVPYDEEDTFFFGVSSRRSCRSSLDWLNFRFFCITGWGINLGYCDIEWFALETNRDHSVIFEISPK